MRVIAGKFRGKRLFSPENDNVRPTTDRIKETLFNILQSETQDCIALDLFAGSGALGIECLSRGAEEVVFVDKSRDSIELINENLKGIDGNFRVINADFLTYLRTAKKKFDLIFIDPPFASPLGKLAVEAIIDLDLLSENGIIVYEHGTENKYKLDRDNYKTRVKVMGSVTVDFIKRQKVCLVTGSFDPITKGHKAVIEKALDMFDKVKVACLINDQKHYLFTSDERLEIAKAALENLENVDVFFSDDTAVNVAKSIGASVFVRGIRNQSDLSYENEMREFNLSSGGIDTVFVEVDEFRQVSSTQVKEKINQGIFDDIPNECIETIKNILDRKK